MQDPCCHRGFDRDDFWRFGILGPWYGYGWWPGYYRYFYSVPYIAQVYSDYGYDAAPYTAYSSDVVEPAVPPENGGETSDFYAQALAAFQQGDYSGATRLASHAAIDNPESPDVHLLLSLGLFALGQYRGSAMEAHAVTALGMSPNWPTVLGFYDNNVNPYTDQLRALEKFVGSNPSAPEGRFLLGFHYMVDGHQDVARDQFLQALKLTPRDNLAAQLLTKVGGTIPSDIAKKRTPPAPAPSKAAPSGMGSGATK